jgi:peptide-methionine (S)-S-oxide reductase
MSGRVVLLTVVIVASLFVLRGFLSGGGGKRASTLNSHPAGVKADTATFGGGCFWHVEDSFRQVEGVISTEVGFEGGSLPKPTYKDVCTDQTGHAEVVQIQYDPTKLSYEKLLEAFFGFHDPTTVNRQGPDVGIQYRSVIFYRSSQQKEQAEAFKAKLQKSGRYKRAIVTEIAPATTFWKAEEYHQQYYEKQRI